MSKNFERGEKMEKLIGKTKENEKEEIEKRKEDKQTEKIEKDQEEKGRKESANIWPFSEKSPFSFTI